MLYGRSGLGMAGVAPVSYTTIRHFALLMDIDPIEPYEVEALVILDAAFRVDEETS